MIRRIRNLSKRIQSSRLLLNMWSIASANLISQAVLLLATPVLTRLYTPESFGVAALFLTALRLTGSISTWRFDRTIPNAGSNRIAVILCGWALLVAIVYCSLLTLFIYIEVKYSQLWEGAMVLGPWLYMLPVAIFFTGIVQIGAAWHARSTHLKAFSRSLLVYTGVYLVVAIVGGLIGMSGSGLILATVFALLGQILVLWKYSSHDRFRLPSKKRAMAGFRRHFRVANTATGVTFVNTLSLTAPVFLLSQVYTVSDLGIYALMSRLVTTPLGVLTKSLSLSFWSRAAELGRNKNIYELHKLYVKVCMTMGIPAFLVALACVVGSYIVVPVLGSQWHDAGPVLLAIVPFVIGHSIASPTNHLWVIEKQEFQYFADCLRLILMLVSILFAYYFQFTFTTTVLLLSFSSLIGHIVLVMIHVQLHKKMIILEQNV